MEITWNTSLTEIVNALGLQDKPWLIDSFTDTDPLPQLGGLRMGQVPMGELTRNNLMQDRQSILDGFRFLMEQGDCLHEIWDAEARAADPGKNRTNLFAFPVPGAKKFLLIIPGGGYYNVCSFVEGFPFAKRCRELGIASFILQYRSAAFAHYPNPQEDAAQAVRYILANRDAFGLEGTDYAVLGFSAGGHLAASFGVEQLGFGRFGVPRPQAELLGYPVITMSDLTHDGSRQNLLCEDSANPEVREQWSVERQISGSYPPTFVWNCTEDCVVPAENSAMLEAALRAHGIPVVHETFPGTVHGWGLADGTPAEGWFDRALKFWEDNSKQ